MSETIKSLLDELAQVGARYEKGESFTDIANRILGIAIDAESDLRAMIARLAQLEAEARKAIVALEKCTALLSRVATATGMDGDRVYSDDELIAHLCGWKQRIAQIEASRLALESLYLTVFPQEDPAFPAVSEMEEVIGAQLLRTQRFDAYLKARGLPLDTPPERYAEWGWVVMGDDGVVRGVVYSTCPDSAYLASTVDTHPIRWDRATPEQREQAG